MRKSREEKVDIVVWNLQVPKSLDDAVEEIVKKDFHMTKAEFIRDSVREKLKSLGVK